MYNELKEIYQSLVTPCYILDSNKLDRNYDELPFAFTSQWKKFIVGYSFKTNSLPWVLNYMKNKGAYAEVVSEEEYRLAIKLGFEKDKVVINGPYKGFNALRDTLDDGAIVNLDSFHEIQWIKNNKPLKSKVWNVGIRINFNLEKACENETIMGVETGAPSFKEYADTICDILEETFDKDKVTLILESGAALIASPFKYLCKVIDKKDVIDTRIVTTDGSKIHIDPQMNGIKFFQECFGSGNLMEKTQIISGFTCIEKDRIAIVKNENELNIDDYILFHNTGAYSMALSPLFIKYYPAVYVVINEEILMVRKPWTVDVYLMKSYVFN